MTIDRWDSDLWALNTPSGILDLKTGELSAHRRDALLQKNCTGQVRSNVAATAD